MKFRKKPVVIEAFQWTGKGGFDQTGATDWIIGAFEDQTVWMSKGHGPDLYLNIKTLEGWMKANPGDYIIQGIKGELYPCKADIFEATYEAV